MFDTACLQLRFCSNPNIYVIHVSSDRHVFLTNVNIVVMQWGEGQGHKKSQREAEGGFASADPTIILTLRFSSIHSIDL